MAVELTEAGRKARATYLREYRKQNKERLKDNATAHWNKVGAQMEAEEKEEISELMGTKTMSKTAINAVEIFSEKLELGLCDDWAPCERLLMYELIRKWNDCGCPHRFSVSNVELAQNTGLSKPTIIRARKGLMARGGIKYIPTGNPRRAGQYSLEPLFQTKQEETDSYLEAEEAAKKGEKRGEVY